LEVVNSSSSSHDSDSKLFIAWLFLEFDSVSIHLVPTLAYRPTKPNDGLRCRDNCHP
jgi:hypothetical protein